MTNFVSNGPKRLENLNALDSINSLEESTSVFKTSMRVDTAV